MLSQCMKNHFQQNVSFTAKNENDEVVKKFIQELIKIRDEYACIPPCEINMAPNDIIKHEQTTKCYLCDKEFTPEDNKVRDHDHHNGHYRGALHNSCNLKLQNGKFVPVMFHNLKGYDSHVFINTFHDLEETPDGIPQNSEKFISFSLYQKEGIELRFLDSMAYMSDSLSNLAKNLKEKPILIETFGKDMAKDLSRKGIFLYEWFDSLEKFEQIEFPDYEDFRSMLSGLEEKTYIDKNGEEKTTLVGKNIEKKNYDYGVEMYKKYVLAQADRVVLEIFSNYILRWMFFSWQMFLKSLVICVLNTLI